MNPVKKLRCLIVDDEPPAREVLRRYVQEMPMLELAGECANAIQALGVLQQQQVDLLFLDIRMPQLNGNDFLKTLRNPPRVIFTTAYPDYAIEGYELDAVDYLLKPVHFDRFLKAVSKLMQNAGPAAEAVPPAKDMEETTAPFVYFRADRKMVKLLLQDIFYIESMKDYVKVVNAGKTIISKQSISSVEEMLPEKKFIRCHRSYIVSVEKVKSFTNEIIETGGTEIPIGKLYRNEVIRSLGQGISI